MEKTKKILRFVAFVFFILLASIGLGMGQVFSNTRENYMEAEIKIEQVEKKEDEDDAELKDIG